jgi:hypothetical protein
MIKCIRILTCVIIVLIFAATVQGQLQLDLVLSDEEAQTLTFDVVPTMPNVSAVMTFDRLVACNAENITDAVVLCVLDLPLEAQVKDLADKGASAVIFQSVSGVLGFTNLLRQGKNIALVLPSFEVHPDDFNKLAANLEANITLSNIVINPQLNLWVGTLSGPGLYVMQIVLGVISAVLIIFGAIKFRAVLQWFNGCRLSITHVLIWLEIIANFLRLLMLVDPLGFRIYSWNVQNAISTLHVPFSVSSALLVTLYWHESLQLYSLKINPFLRKMFWPFIVITLLALALEAGAIVVRITVKNLFGTSFIVVYSYYLFILTGVIIFYSLTASRILRYMTKSEKMGKIWQRRKRATVLMIVGGSGLVLSILGTLGSILAFGSATSWLVCTSLTVVGFDICSAALLVAIRAGGTPVQSLNTSNKRSTRSSIGENNTQHSQVITHRSTTEETQSPVSFTSSPLKLSSPSNMTDSIRPKLTDTTSMVPDSSSSSESGSDSPSSGPPDSTQHS